MSVRSPFESLLQETARLKDWTFIAELSGKSGGAIIRPDGTLRDRNSLPRGYWEAKDTQDDLDTEIKQKIARGYPLSNIIFEDTQTGVLFQSKQKINGPYSLGNPKELAALLNQFFSYTEPDIEGFEEAVDEFKERVPDLARGLVEKIQQAHKDNARFQAAFEKFFDLCRTALNPNIRVEAVDEMLVQHLLTERLIRTVFNNPEFAKRNAIAAEVERVIDALVSHSFDRTEYLKSLDRFYRRHRRRRALAARLQRKAALPEHRLRALLPGLLGEAGRHAWHRLYAAGNRQLHVRERGRGAGKGIWQEPFESRCLHHRPLHRHRKLCREPAAPHARPRLAPRVPRAAFRQ